MKKDFKKYLNQLRKQLGDNIGMIGAYRFELENVETGEKEVKFYHNLIPTVGRTMICNNLTDPTPDNDMLVNYIALGTDDTAVAESDTVLGTETYRNAVASKTNSANVAYVTGYFSQTECNGTYKEAGIFCDGTASVDTGILLSHVNIDVTKTNVQKLTVDWVLTLLTA